MAWNELDKEQEPMDVFTTELHNRIKDAMAHAYNMEPYNFIVRDSLKTAPMLYYARITIDYHVLIDVLVLDLGTRCVIFPDAWMTQNL